jgi:hypothetical protein
LTGASFIFLSIRRILFVLYAILINPHRFINVDIYLMSIFYYMSIFNTIAITE